jgi:chromosome segregation ATPase
MAAAEEVHTPSPKATPRGPPLGSPWVASSGSSSGALPKAQVAVLLGHLRSVIKAYKKRKEHVQLLRSALRAKTEALESHSSQLRTVRATADAAQRDLRAAEEAISSLEFARDNLVKRIEVLREDVSVASGRVCGLRV